ncbi:hypothetical protein KSS87_015662 [Heliosperma pusillum]|nr:hypothetical protein KSS87_015662 [Heliosperma pusillum]
MSYNSSSKHSCSNLEALREITSTLRDKNDILEDELRKLKAEQVIWDVERSRLYRELEVKDEKLNDLATKLGFSNEVKAKAIKRYDRSLEYSKEVEAKMEGLKKGIEVEMGELSHPFPPAASPWSSAVHGPPPASSSVHLPSKVYLLVLMEKSSTEADLKVAIESPADDIGSPDVYVFPMLEGNSDLPIFFRDDADRTAKLNIFKDSPFLCLLSADSKPRSNPVFKLLACSYDRQKEAFCLDGKYLKLCADEAAHVLGMRNDGTEASISSTVVTPPPSYYINLVDNGEEKSLLTKSSIQGVLTKMVINDDNKDDFKRIMYVYLYKYVFAVKSTKKTVGDHAFSLVEDIDSFEKTNWVKLMFERTMAEVRKLANIHQKRTCIKKVSLNCFTPLLEAWYYYRTNSTVDKILFQDNSSVPLHFSRVPLHFYKSDSRFEKLKKRLKAKHIKHGCASCEVRELELEHSAQP